MEGIFLSSKKRKTKVLWTKLFGIKVGDLVRFKYGKVDWQVWATGTYTGETGKWKGTHRWWKLRRRRQSKNFFRRDILHEIIWEWDLVDKEVRKVGEV